MLSTIFCMAEREGFEPSVQVYPVHSLSRRAPSADSATSPCIHSIIEERFITYFPVPDNTYYSAITVRAVAATAILIDRKGPCTLSSLTESIRTYL